MPGLIVLSHNLLASVSASKAKGLRRGAGDVAIAGRIR